MRSRSHLNKHFSILAGSRHKKNEVYMSKYMIHAIDYEQTFVTNLEQFVSKADKYIKVYYSGLSEDKHLKEIVQGIKNLAMEIDIQQLEIDYQHHCEIKDLMADYDDLTWW
ncbi:Pb-reticulocyte-binding protein [Brunnivagina elsteri]